MSTRSTQFWSYFLQVLVKDLLRKYPQWSHDCIAVVGCISTKNVQEPKAKAALIWMLGEYSQDMHDAPYILESLIENWDEEHSAEVSTYLFCNTVIVLFPWLVDFFTFMYILSGW